MVAVSRPSKTINTEPASDDAQLDRLAERLEHGFQVIEERQSAGLPVESYEQHWLKLLAEYETLFRQSTPLA